MPGTRTDVCRVNMKEADLQTGIYTVLVQIQSPVSLGAEGCERIAHQAAKSMMLDARECHIGSCNFDGRTGLFFVEISARYETFRPALSLNERVRKQLSFSVISFASKSLNSAFLSLASFILQCRALPACP